MPLEHLARNQALEDVAELPSGTSTVIGDPRKIPDVFGRNGEGNSRVRFTSLDDLSKLH